MAKRSITYYWGDRNLLIKLGNRTQPRIRALYVIEFLVTTGMATVFLVQSLPFKHNFVNWTATIGASVLYLLSLYRFLARIFFSERIMLDQHTLTLVKKTIFAQQVRRFEWRRIGMLHYEGKGTKTDHPLKGKCFDYFGFETHEHLIQSLHHDGNLYFDTLEGRVYFAAGVYSWDAEEMVQMMKLYIGASLQLGPEWKEMLQEM
ncbi:MAG: hypothetical protein K0Q79_429 [Flavipsychrobacter sp.]|nr:hypothetical protein [Flavipsychrobacter sp.]